MNWQFALAMFVAVATMVNPAAAAGTYEPPVPRNDAQLDGMRPGATPAERPLRPFAGWLTVTGCRFRVDGSFIGRVQDGWISGMAAGGANFSWPIGADGSFEGKIALGGNTDGDRVHQSVKGHVERDRLIMDVEFGVPGKPDSYCRGVGQELKLGG